MKKFKIWINKLREIKKKLQIQATISKKKNNNQKILNGKCKMKKKKQKKKI